jgi:hypothetical protein
MNTEPTTAMKKARRKLRMSASRTGKLGNQSLPRPAASRSSASQLSHPMGEGQDVMLSKEELAAKLKVSVRTIENWQHEGYLPFIKVANVVMFYWPTVVAHLQTHFSVSPRGVVSPQTKN